MKKLLLIFTAICLPLIFSAQSLTTTYEYDELNRLVMVTYPNGQQVQYEYDVLGNRISRTVTQIGYVIQIDVLPEGSGTASGAGFYNTGVPVTLSASANSGFVFLNWTVNDEVVSTSASYTFTPNSPVTVTANFGVQQLSNLSTGWNWWSTYIEQTDVLAALENSLGHYGVTIKSQNEFVDNYYQYMNYDYWYGSLESINNEKSYLVNVTANCNVSLGGVRSLPENHPIAIEPNWNWIGYPTAMAQTVVSALGGFSPSGDDVIKAQNDYSFYYEGYGWFPEDFMLVPGKGYKYYSTATNNKVLTYAGESRGDFAAEKSENHYWAVDSHAYADNLNVTAVVLVDNVEQRNEHLELGAFVNGECRGSARLRHFAPLDRYYAMLTVSGQDGERVEFGYVDTENGQYDMVSEDHITFAQDAILGILDKPFEVRFGKEDQFQNYTEHLMIYPNPVEKNQAFVLDIPWDEVVTEFTVTNMLGAMVRHESGTVKLRTVNGLTTSGVYMIEVVARSGNIYRGKLIVK